jgi:hypothetical protein
MIASFLRIGRKYEFKELLDIAVDRLTFENPTSLKEYDALTAACGGEYAMTRIVQSSSILLDVLTLARENDIMTVLPCAYYRVLMAYDQVASIPNQYKPLLIFFVSLKYLTAFLGKMKHLLHSPRRTNVFLYWPAKRFSKPNT